MARTAYGLPGAYPRGLRYNPDTSRAPEVDRRQLPPLGRRIQPFPEAFFLLFLVARQPIFEQQDSIVDELTLEFRSRTQECLALRIGAKAHDAFDARAIVPASIEQRDFTAGRQMFDIALEIPLTALTL